MDGSHNCRGQESTPLPPTGLATCPTPPGDLWVAFAVHTCSVLGGLTLGTSLMCLQSPLPAALSQAGDWGTDGEAGCGRGQVTGHLWLLQGELFCCLEGILEVLSTGGETGTGNRGRSSGQS